MSTAKKLIGVTALVLGVGIGVGILGIGKVTAVESGTFPSIVQRLVERFNLNEGEVQAVVDEFREEKHAEMQAKLVEKLDAAVADGKLTETQKDAILAKEEEMRAKHEELRDLEPEERREAMRELREEMRAWAEENGLKRPGFGHRGFGRGF